MRSSMRLALLVSAAVGALSQDDESQILKQRQAYVWPTFTRTVTVHETSPASTVTVSVRIPCTLTGPGSPYPTSDSGPYGNGTGSIPLSTAVSTDPITGSATSSVPWGVTSGTGYPVASSSPGVWYNTSSAALESSSRPIWGTGTGGHHPPPPYSTGLYNASSIDPLSHSHSHSHTEPPGPGPTAPWGTGYPTPPSGTGYPAPPSSSTGIYSNTSAADPLSTYSATAPIGTGSSFSTYPSGYHHANTTLPVIWTTGSHPTSQPHPTVTSFNVSSVDPTHTRQPSSSHSEDPSYPSSYPSGPGDSPPHYSHSSQPVRLSTGGSSSSLPIPSSSMPYHNASSSSSPEFSSAPPSSYITSVPSTTSLPVPDTTSLTAETHTLNSTLTVTHTHTATPKPSSTSEYSSVATDPVSESTSASFTVTGYPYGELPTPSSSEYSADPSATSENSGHHYTSSHSSVSPEPTSSRSGHHTSSSGFTTHTPVFSTTLETKTSTSSAPTFTPWSYGQGDSGSNDVGDDDSYDSDDYSGGVE